MPIEDTKKQDNNVQPGYVDITGLNKDEVVRALWRNSKPASVYVLSAIPLPELDESLVKRVLSSDRPYFDYLCGRVMKTDFSTNFLNPWLYDRDNGEGSMKEIVEKLRSTEDQDSTSS
jgi:hypothetical protein